MHLESAALLTATHLEAERLQYRAERDTAVSAAATALATYKADKEAAAIREATVLAACKADATVVTEKLSAKHTKEIEEITANHGVALDAAIIKHSNDMAEMKLASHCAEVAAVAKIAAESETALNCQKKVEQDCMDSLTEKQKEGVSQPL